MRRTPILLLALLVLVLLGLVWIGLAPLGTSDRTTPGGGQGVGSESAPASGDPLHRADPASPREPVATRSSRPSPGRLLVRVAERGRGVAIEGASLAVHPAGVAGENATAFEVLDNPPEEVDARTDGQGRAEIEVPSGIPLRMEVRGSGPDIGRSELSIPALQPDEHREVQVDLPRGLDLEHWVRTVSAGEEVPVEGASVRLLVDDFAEAAPDGDDSNAIAPSARTDARGLAWLRAPSWRSAIARIDAEGFGPILAALVRGHEHPSRAQVLRLSRAASLAARVTSDPGIPLPDATLVLTTSRSEIAVPRGTRLAGSDLEWSARTDAHGECRIEGLPAEVPLRVEIRRADRMIHALSDPLVLSPGEVAERTLCIGDAARIRGMLVGWTSEAIPGVVIWLSRATVPQASGPDDRSAWRYSWVGSLEEPFAAVRTEEDGTFVFEGVGSGDWWVGPAPVRAADPGADGKSAERVFAPRAIGVSVPVGASEVEVLLQAERPLWIRGKVVDAEAAPVANTLVEARPEDALGLLSTRTGVDGAFALGPLAPGAFGIRAKGRWGMADSSEATARAGDRDVVLKLSPGAVLRGRVIDQETGAPRVATLLLSSGTDDPWTAISSAGRDGSFEFTGLRAGSYGLVARSHDGRVGVLRDVAVRAGAPSSQSSGVILSLAPGGKLRIRHGGNVAWGRFTVLSGGVVLAVGSLRAGTSAVVSVPIERVLVRFAATGEALQEREVEAAPGEETEVDFSSG